MKIFYSAGTGGFYDSEIHAAVPQDAVEITREQHQALIDGQSSGMQIVPDAAGAPVLAEPLSLMSLDALKVEMRKRVDRARDAGLNYKDAIVAHAGHDWQAKPDALDELTRLTTLFMALGSAPAGFEWRDVNNVNVPADLSLLAGIGAAIAGRRDLIWKQSWSIKASIDAATTAADVQAITIPERLEG